MTGAGEAERFDIEERFWRRMRYAGPCRNTNRRTSHYNKGPAACAHVDQWPMEEIDHEVLGTMTESLGAELESEITAEARRQFDAHARPDRSDQIRKDLERVEREQARCTEAIASGAGAIPALVARLRSTEAKRSALASELEQARKPSSAPSWAEIERRLQASLKGWRSLLTGGVGRARQGLRQLMATPIQFTPFIDGQGFRAIRFEGRWSLEGVFDGVVTKMASPMPASWNHLVPWLRAIDQLSCAYDPSPHSYAVTARSRSARSYGLGMAPLKYSFVRPLKWD